jgi:colanic acid/amylovoran biosynthesis glycosyltransferase
MDGMESGSRMNGQPLVAHSMRKFLPMSQNWIYPQITALRRYRAVVVTNQTMNEAAFPLAKGCLRVIPRRHRDLAEAVSAALRLGRDTPSYWRRELGAAVPTVVHSHFGNRAYFDMEVVKRMRVAHVVTFYGHDLSRLPHNPLWKGRFRELFRRAALFTVEGSHMKASLAALDCPETKIRIRRHGVDLETYRYIPRSIGADGMVKILVAARFVEKKGIPVAVRAVAELAQRHPKLQLTVIGDANPNDAGGTAIKREVQSLLQSPPLAQCSRWVGSVSFQQFMTIAEEHHLFIQASQHARDGDSEGGAPVTLLQLAATGMPIVATRHCDIPEVVLDGVTGALALERDASALAASLERLVSAPDSWTRLGEQARRHIQHHFELSRCMADLEDIYDEAAEVRRSSRTC